MTCRMHLVGDDMKWDEFASKVLSISRIGKKYSKDPYAIDNYEQLEELSIKMLNEASVEAVEKNIYERDIYPTPNVSVRILVINEKDEVLMVQEKDDGRWAVPGGWCDVFISVKDNAIKEVKEETGLDVEIDCLLGIFQREKYKDYPSLVSEYVHYFSATVVGGSLNPNFEVSKAAYFPLNELPELSRKNTIEELKRAFQVYYKETDVQFD